ncbi:MAG TPA: hypothetical protein P5055_06865 [Candidatus Paceibacterota bacterium]|nr:hypothetical protein [Candidatus Paceibacterota bacterium]
MKFEIHRVQNGVVLRGQSHGALTGQSQLLVIFFRQIAAVCRQPIFNRFAFQSSVHHPSAF